MHCLRWVQKQRRRSRRAECRRDFLCNDSALAHSGDDNPAAPLAAADNQLHSAAKGLSHLAIEPHRKRLQRSRFHAHQLRRRQISRILTHHAIPMVAVSLRIPVTAPAADSSNLMLDKGAASESSYNWMGYANP